VRDGYEAPTPLTVVGVEQFQQQASPNVIDYLTTLPAFSGNYTPQGSSQNVSSGTAGTSAVNLRNLGTNRTLVLIDGQRSVPSTVTGLVDINTIPSQLIERVEVVTGGASAAYGSDAVSGVVNFILDKKFTGFKSEAAAGVTTYGDNENYSIALTGGFPFAEGRGHVLLSGQYKDQDGILDGDRDWNKKGWQIINNPNYTATNGQPRRLLLPEIAPSNATPGGIIVSGPLRGTAFGQGGVPYQFQYGPLISGSAMQGGDWRSTSLHEIGQSIEPKFSSENLFARVSYGITDNIEAFLQTNWYSNDNTSNAYPNDAYFGGMIVRADNPFLPASVAAQAQALGLQTLELGSSLRDMGGVVIDTSREVLRNVVGLNGGFNAWNVDWEWNAYYQHGESRSTEAAVNSANLVRHRESLDAVINPANGAIVCRSTLTTPGNGCVPYNPFGVGVNSREAIDYVAGTRSQRNQLFKQDVVAATISGTPFSSWAGPVSIATGLEHRRESASGRATENDLAGVFFAGNYRPTFGKYNVTEGFVETAVPLATDMAWAESLELNAALRLTDYSTSGSVETWKVGVTYTPIEDVRFRATRSRDIRAPNINDLFNAGARVNNQVIDNTTGLAVATEDITTGNRELQPEIADSLGVGVVFQPSFAPGLSASVDYWEIDLKDAINTVGRQQTVDLCSQGNQQFCQAINNGQPLRPTTGSDRNIIRIQPFNLAQQLVRGLDIEAGYNLPLETIGLSEGRVGLRLLATRFLENYRNDTVSVPTDTAGENYGTTGSPDWRWSAILSYDRTAFNTSLTARGVSSGVYSNAMIECQSNCPTSTIPNPTINENDLSGAVYLDLAMEYQLLIGANDDTEVELFVNVKNIADKDPVIAVGGPTGLPFDTVSTNTNNYDSHGRVFRAGFRVKM
jgi:outer membrane receptor protein involved in Fe transport